MSVTQCEALEELFTRRRRRGRTIEEESSPEIETLCFDSEPSDEEDDIATLQSARAPVDESVRCLESWVLACSERGWGLVTFCHGT